MGVKGRNANRRMEKQEMVMSVAPESIRGQGNSSRTLSWGLLSSDMSSVPHDERKGQAPHIPLQGALLATLEQMSPELRQSYPEVYPSAQVMPTFPQIFWSPFIDHDPNSPSSGMGRGPQRPEGETLLKEAGRGWGRSPPPAEGFSSWRKDRGGVSSN